MAYKYKVKGWFRVTYVHPCDPHFNTKDFYGLEVRPIQHWRSAIVHNWYDQELVAVWCEDRKGRTIYFHAVKLEPLNKRWPLVPAE